jgi:hypothetical protein
MGQVMTIVEMRNRILEEIQKVRPITLRKLLILYLYSLETGKPLVRDEEKGKIIVDCERIRDAIGMMYADGDEKLAEEFKPSVRSARDYAKAIEVISMINSYQDQLLKELFQPIMSKLQTQLSEQT